MRYDDPVMHEYALDDCYEFKKQCGDEAANAFCQENGYVKAIDYATRCLLKLKLVGIFSRTTKRLTI